MLKQSKAKTLKKFYLKYDFYICHQTFLHCQACIFLGANKYKLYVGFLSFIPAKYGAKREQAKPGVLSVNPEKGTSLDVG